MRKIILFMFSISLTGGLAIAQDEADDTKPNPGARIAAYGKIGRVIVDGQTIYISKGMTDIIMEEGSADLVNDSKIQCEHIKRTGSHISMRICRTVAEIKEQSEFNREYFERWFLRQRTSICATGGGTRAVRTSNPTFGVQGSSTNATLC